jgi:threonine dehydratase
VSIEEWAAAIAEARPLVDAAAVRTPMLESRWLSSSLDRPVWLKCENLQRTGSFKIRGAAVRINRLTEEERARGVVAASAGNHAQGVALAAQQAGIHATVFMPEGAPIPKERATRGYGAEVVFGGRFLEDCLGEAREYADRTGAAFVHPFDHHDIVAGQGSLGLELLEQLPEAATVVVPTGGGGLLAGVAVAVKSRRPDVRMVGVQASAAAAYPPSIAAGRPVRLKEMATMADGIAVGEPGTLTFELVRDHVDEIRTVSEESMSRALVALVEREKLVVEPAGAVGAAALLDIATGDAEGDFAGPIVVVLSGGNIDPLLLGKVIVHGMSAGRRYLSLQVTIADVPGGLARLLTLVGELGGNVLEVVHERVSPGLHLGEVEVLLQLETRGEPHAEALLEGLRGAGYVVVERS